MDELSVRTRHGTVAAIDFGGDGPDIVLLHGAGRTLWDWALVFPHLNRVRVVAMDFRWHGLSSDTGDVEPEANADDLEDLIRELGLRNPVIAGHSLGGMTAAIYGTRHPGCPGVVNLDGRGNGVRSEYPVGDEQYAHFSRVMDTLVARFESEPRSGDDDWRDAVIAGWQQQAEQLRWSFPPEMVAAATERSFRKDAVGLWHRRPGAGYQAMLRASMSSLSMLDAYHACRAPLLNYWCTKIPPMPDAESNEVFHARLTLLRRELDALALERPSSRVRYIDATHMVVFEAPEIIAEDILALAGGPGSGAAHVRYSGPRSAGRERPDGIQ